MPVLIVAAGLWAVGPMSSLLADEPRGALSALDPKQLAAECWAREKQAHDALPRARDLVRQDLTLRAEYDRTRSQEVLDHLIRLDRQREAFQDLTGIDVYKYADLYKSEREAIAALERDVRSLRDRCRVLDRLARMDAESEAHTDIIQAARTAILECNFRTARETIVSLEKAGADASALRSLYAQVEPKAAATRREYEIGKQANLRGNDFYRQGDFDKAAEQYRLAEAKFTALLVPGNEAYPPCERYKRVIKEAVEVVGRNRGRAAAGLPPPEKSKTRRFGGPRYQGLRISSAGFKYSADEFCKKQGYARSLRHETETVRESAYNMAMDRPEIEMVKGREIEVFSLIECTL